MFTPEQYIQIFIAYWVLMVAVIIAFKVRGRGKLRALILTPSMYYTVKGGKTEANKLKLSKDWIPTFKPSNIFEEKKAWYKFWRNAIRLVLVPEQGTKAVGWKAPDAKEFSELAFTWTLKDIKKFIKKEVLKARMASKPISNSMFILLLMLGLGTLLLVLVGFMRMGVF